MPQLLQHQDQAAQRRETVARGPVRPGERALAPDLARGFMLLLIVLSNTGFHLWAATHGAVSLELAGYQGAVDAEHRFSDLCAAAAAWFMPSNRNRQ